MLTWRASINPFVSVGRSSLISHPLQLSRPSQGPYVSWSCRRPIPAPSHGGFSWGSLEHQSNACTKVDASWILRPCSCIQLPSVPLKSEKLPSLGCLERSDALCLRWGYDYAGTSAFASIHNARAAPMAVLDLHVHRRTHTHTHAHINAHTHKPTSSYRSTPDS